LDSIGYDKTRYQNGHIDYLSRSKGAGFYQMLFPPTEFGVGIYSPIDAKKWIDIFSTPSTFTLQVFDAFDNFSTAVFEIQSVAKTTTEIVRDGTQMKPGVMNIFENELVRFVFKEDAFYDAFHFNYNAYNTIEKDAVSSVIQTLPEYIPVQSYFSVSIKPNRVLALLNPERIVMERKYRGKIEIKKTVKEREFFTAQFRDFGYFKLLEDIQPPIISANVVSGKLVNGSTRIVIDVSDNNSVIKDFRASIDGEWVMFLPSGNRFSYYPDEHFPAGEHKLSVVVYDEAGNMAMKEWNLKR
jgi:hypothetical protein